MAIRNTKTTAKGAKSNMAAKTKATKAAPKNSQALAKRGNQGMQENDFLKYAGVGLESIEQRHLAVPFLYLLQPGSPQVKKRNEQYIEGAEAGNFMYTLDGSLYEDITVIPCHFYDNVVEWRKRESGQSGLVKIYPDMETAKANRVLDEDESNLVPTYNFLLQIVEDDGSLRPALFPCSSTKITPARTWLSNLRIGKWRGPDGQEVPAPIFGYTWKLSPVYQSNGSNDWFIFQAEQGDDLSGEDNILQICDDLNSSFKGGKAKINYASDSSIRVEGDEDDVNPNF